MYQITTATHHNTEVINTDNFIVDTVINHFDELVSSFYDNFYISNIDTIVNKNIFNAVTRENSSFMKSDIFRDKSNRVFMVNLYRLVYDVYSFLTICNISQSTINTIMTYYSRDAKNAITDNFKYSHEIDSYISTNKYNKNNVVNKFSDKCKQFFTEVPDTNVDLLESTRSVLKCYVLLMYKYIFESNKINTTIHKERGIENFVEIIEKELNTLETILMLFITIVHDTPGSKFKK